MWDLMDRPLVWTQWALAAQKAENMAEREAHNRASRRANKPRR